MTTIALSLTTAVDTHTARQLHDYGDLDDAGVVAALEQTGLQRGQRWPGYLSRVQRVAIVLDDGGDLTLAAFEASTSAQEHGVLESLFALLPMQADGRSVAWDEAAWRLLTQRAYHHELQAPTPVHAWPRQPLCELFENVGARALHSDAATLYGGAGGGGAAAELADLDPVLRDAVRCYVMDLRWRCVTGAMTADASRQRAARAVARAMQVGVGAAS